METMVVVVIVFLVNSRAEVLSARSLRVRWTLVSFHSLSFQFAEWAGRVCSLFEAEGFWADFIDPCSGLAVRSSPSIAGQGRSIPSCARPRRISVVPCRACGFWAADEDAGLVGRVPGGGRDGGAAPVQDVECGLLQDPPPPSLGLVGLPRLRLRAGSTRGRTPAARTGERGGSTPALCRERCRGNRSGRRTRRLSVEGGGFGSLPRDLYVTTLCRLALAPLPTRSVSDPRTFAMASAAAAAAATAAEIAAAEEDG